MLARKAHPPLVRTAVTLLTGAALPFLWPGLFLNLFSTVGFEIDHHDNWPASLVVLHVGSDVLIGLSYAVIASILAFIVHQNRRHLPFDWVVLSFGLFIIACGLTHIMHVVTRFTPVYYLDTYIRALTAIVSVATALALPPLIPRVGLLLAADQELKRKKQELEAANMLLRAQQRDVQQANLQLQEARNSAEFHASLSDLLQDAHDPDTLVKQVLHELGPALKVDHIMALKVTLERVKLWHAWGTPQPHAWQLTQQEGTPLTALPVISEVVASGETCCSWDRTETAAEQVPPEKGAVAFEPIKNSHGEVVVVLVFTCNEPWAVQEQQVASRAALAIGRALERTELQQQLQTSQQQLLEAQRYAPMAEITLDFQGKPIRVNPAACRLLGYREEELFQMRLADLTHPEDQADLLENLQKPAERQEGRAFGEIRQLRKDGSILWVHLQVSLVRDVHGSPQHVIVQFTDITERKHAEQERDQALRHREAQVRISQLLED